MLLFFKSFQPESVTLLLFSMKQSYAFTCER